MRHRSGFTTGEQPPDDRGERWHAEDDEEEVRDRDVPESCDPAI